MAGTANVDKAKNIKAALEALGIYTVEDLNDAIRKMKPLDISLMAAGHIDRKTA